MVAFDALLTRFLTDAPIWPLILLAVAFALYKYGTRNFGIFKQLGINGPRPWPFIGTSLSMIREGLMTHDLKLKKYGKVVGTFRGRRPMLMIYDPDVLKQIMIGDFSNFSSRMGFPIPDYPLDKMLVNLQGEHWKRVRSVLTPTFSSGKLRKMNDQFQSCAETLLNNLLEKAETGETCDFKALCGAYTMDVIASAAFGLKIDSHNDPNNQFVTMGRKASTPSAFFIIAFFPNILKAISKLGFTLFPKDMTRFFINIINQSLDERRKELPDDGQTKHVDFIQLMANADVNEEEGGAKKSTTSEGGVSETGEKLKGLNHSEVLAQSFLFFLAGFETTANALSLLGYSLATNPEKQEKLLKEIDEVMKDKDIVDYDIVKQMPYLDMCISETLRLYPASIRTDRIASNDCTINGVFIPKDMVIISPIYAMHMDPEVWPEPTKFIPERFTPKEKAARNPYYYMPFGVGPRNCVGMRLALTELKTATVHVLQKIKFAISPETQIPLKLSGFRLLTTDGIKLRLEKRHQAN